MSGLASCLVGVLVSRDQLWIAAAIGVAGRLLLELKVALEGLTKRISAEEILTIRVVRPHDRSAELRFTGLTCAVRACTFDLVWLA